MIKITPDNMNELVTGAIIAHYPVNGDPQDNFEEGENTIPWTIMGISGSGFKLATAFIGSNQTIAKDLKLTDELLNGCWWYYEEADLEHMKR